MSLLQAPLGKTSDYPVRYAPEVLFAVPREENRSRLNIGDEWPWYGEDVWQAYEMSWLKPSGVPVVAIGRFRVPAGSPFLIESKSFKLYLNSFNQERVADEAMLRQALIRDLSAVAGAPVAVEIRPLVGGECLPVIPDGYLCVDDLLVNDVSYEYQPEVLRIGDGAPVSEKLCSHLLKSNCPVTGQPDWGSLLVEYTGAALDHAGLLRYVIGFRNKQDFHEHCVETVFVDLMRQCAPERLTVMACYTRRGGLDINPWRSTEPGHAPGWRLLRQ